MSNYHQAALNIYSAQKSKSGKYINLTLVEGHGDSRTFYHVPVKITGEGNVCCLIDGSFANISVKITTPKTAPEKKPEEVARDCAASNPYGAPFTSAD